LYTIFTKAILAAAALFAAMVMEFVAAFFAGAMVAVVMAAFFEAVMFMVFFLFAADVAMGVMADFLFVIMVLNTKMAHSLLSFPLIC
jgi:hypothetical protein